MTDMTDGSESSETQPTTISTGSMFSDTRPLNERLSEHLENCSKCQTVTEGGLRPIGFGMRTPLCSEYQDIVAVWAEQEGQVNNIVAHDEFGNQASTADYSERYPDAWR